MVSLKPMTRQMCHEFYKGFQNDPAIGHYYEYVYTPEIADRYFNTNSVADRKLFAIMVGDQIVGECKLKNIDLQKRECSMGIHLQNDAVKEKGYGTQAERLVLQYAFEELGMPVMWFAVLIARSYGWNPSLLKRNTAVMVLLLHYTAKQKKSPLTQIA